MKPCPKCGHEIKIWELSQYCPNCKVNLMFYGFEDRFYEDAKKAEMSLANVRVKLEKVKTGLVGGKTAIARLACVLLPLLALLVPFGEVRVSMPIYEKSLSVNALGLFSSFTDGTFSLLGGIGDSPVIGQSALRLQTAMLGFVGCAGVTVLIFLITILGFISFKKMATILCALSAAGIGTAVFTATAFARIPAAGELLTVHRGFGAFAMCAAFVVIFVLNIIIALRGLPIEFKEGDLERVEMRKRYRKNEITLEDIPYPIYQTDAEREARQAAIEKTAAEMAMAAEGGENNG